MGRQQLDLSVGQHTQLHTRALKPTARDALLHNPPALDELFDVDAERRGLRLQFHPLEPLHDARSLVRRPRRWEPGQGHNCIALSRDALVELHDRTLHGGTSLPHAHERISDLVQAVQVLGTQRMRHPDLLEEPSTARLRTKVGQSWIGTVHRDPDAQCDIAFEARWCRRNHV